MRKPISGSGYSDWSTQAFPERQQSLEFRIIRQGGSYLVFYREAEGQPWLQIRMAHLDHSPEARVLCGLYACSPIDAGFRAEFKEIRIEPGI